MDKTAIEWCDSTFNPWMGCTAVSPGCDNCYAEKMMGRYGVVKWGNHPRKPTGDQNWKKPLKWAKDARAERRRWESYPLHPATPPPARPRVFCASLADVFDNQAPDHWRYRLWDLILETPELDWLLLTKRPQNIHKMIPLDWTQLGLPKNIWLGMSAENQTEYDRRYPHLMGVPAAVHFVSYEPALGPLFIGSAAPPDWIICGGEDRFRDGRVMDLKWARDLRDECQRIGTAFFFKQTTGKGKIPADLMVREFPTSAATRSAS